MKTERVEAGLVLLATLYLVPEFLILFSFSAQMKPWIFALLVQWLPLFLATYYWLKVRSLAYGFLMATVLNIIILANMSWDVFEMILPSR